MVSLPVELYRLIVSSFTGSDRSTLLALMASCRDFHAEAETQLYREFVHTSTNKSLDIQLSFLRTVTQSPSKATLVRLYMFFECPLRDKDPFWPLFRDFLHAVPNLKELGFGVSSGTPRAGILHGCTFQLEVLRWECPSDEEELLYFFTT